MRTVIWTTFAALLSTAAAGTAVAESGVTHTTPVHPRAASADSLRPDSIEVTRLPMAPPGAERLGKVRAIGRGVSLNDAASRFQRDRLFDLSSAEIAEACGDLGSSVPRWWFRVHDSAGWHELIVPDGCRRASGDLQVQLTKLRLDAFQVWGAQPPRTPFHERAAFVADSVRPDSIEIDRLPMYGPDDGEHLTRGFGPGAGLDSVATRLQNGGLFELSSAQVASACNHPGSTVARWLFRTHDAAGWREVIVPDGCIPESADLADKVKTLRSYAFIMWGRRNGA